MIIRTATLDDLDAIAGVEAECFLPAEAATRETLAGRLGHFAGHFWLMFDAERLVSFVDGMCTDERDLTDDMYSRPEMHNEAGQWQMIFGVNTVPDCRGRGLAGELIRRAVQDSREHGRKGLVLTCKEGLISWYSRFGFASEGVSESVHGGAVWYQMRLEL